MLKLSSILLPTVQPREIDREIWSVIPQGNGKASYDSRLKALFYDRARRKLEDGLGAVPGIFSTIQQARCLCRRTRRPADQRRERP